MNLAEVAPFGIAMLGLLLGMRHATDPDHVIAITTILSRERRIIAAARIGVIWGIGHSLTVLGVGIAIIVFKIALPARLGLAMEFAVAIMLILLGVGAAAGLTRRLARRLFAHSAGDSLVVHSHSHTHSNVTHSHPHVHHAPFHLDSDAHDHRVNTAAAASAVSFAARRPLLRSFGVGLIHGLGGSAALALLVLGAIPQPLWATLYLVVFCLGTVVGMALITVAIATPFIVASRHRAWLHQGFVTGAGLLSFTFGLALAYRIGAVHRLFSAVPFRILH
jgi:high-affinity nickel-transport protein